MVRCPQCGEVVSVTKKYCIACGVRLKRGGGNRELRGNRELGLTLVVSGIVLIAISAGLATINWPYVRLLFPMFMMFTIPLLWIGVSEYRKS